MKPTVYHDQGVAGLPEREYECAGCGMRHAFVRLLKDIPPGSPCCGEELHRIYEPVVTQVTTPTHEIRRKVLMEERAGKRERQDRTVDRSFLKI